MKFTSSQNSKSPKFCKALNVDRINFDFLLGEENDYESRKLKCEYFTLVAKASVSKSKLIPQKGTEKTGRQLASRQKSKIDQIIRKTWQR